MKPESLCQNVFTMVMEKPSPSATSAKPEYAFSTVITTAGNTHQPHFPPFLSPPQLTHIRAPNRRRRRKPLNKAQKRARAQKRRSRHRRRRRARNERRHRRRVQAQDPRVDEVLAREGERPRGHLRGELEEGDDGAGEGDAADDDAEVGGDEVEGGGVRGVGDDGADGGEHGGEADDAGRRWLGNRTR